MRFEITTVVLTKWPVTHFKIRFLTELLFWIKALVGRTVGVIHARSGLVKILDAFWLDRDQLIFVVRLIICLNQFHRPVWSEFLWLSELWDYLIFWPDVARLDCSSDPLHSLRSLTNHPSLLRVDFISGSKGEVHNYYFASNRCIR